MRKLFLLLSLSLVVSLALAPTAMAQGTDFTGPCAVPAEQAGVPTEDFFYYVPAINGCVLAEGQADPLLDQLNGPVYDADTGENLGLLKNVDQNLSDAVTYDEFCGAFPTLSYGGGITAQEYYDAEANAQERAILDPDGDGVACNGDDSPETPGGNGGNGATENQYADEDAGIAQYDGDDVADDEITELPATGGPPLMALAGGLVAAGLGGLLLWRRLS